MKSKGKVKKIWFNENWKLLMRIYYNQISIFCIGYEWVIIAWIFSYLVLISVFSLVKCRQMTISAIVNRMQFSKAITIATSIAWWIVALNITKMNYFIVLFSNKKNSSVNWFSTMTYERTIQQKGRYDKSHYLAQELSKIVK